MDLPYFINLNIASLQYLIATAETGSFSKAAELLHTSQPNVSRHIQNLESELGEKLFIRTPAQTLPTAAGLRCLETARRIVSLAASLRSIVREEPSLLRGSLRVGYASNSFSGFLQACSASFSRAFPEVDLTLQNGAFSDLKDDLMRGQLDLLFMFSSGFQGLTGLSRKTIRLASLYLVVPMDHPFVGRDSVLLSDLSSEHIMLCGNALSSFALDMLTRLSQNREDFPAFSFASYEDNLDGMLERVRKGAGVLLTAYRVPGSSETDVHVLPIVHSLDQAEWNMTVAWKEDNSNPCILPFVDGAVNFEKCGRI